MFHNFFFFTFFLSFFFFSSFQSIVMRPWRWLQVLLVLHQAEFLRSQALSARAAAAATAAPAYFEGRSCHDACMHACVLRLKSTPPPIRQTPMRHGAISSWALMATTATRGPSGGTHWPLSPAPLTQTATTACRQAFASERKRRARGSHSPNCKRFKFLLHVQPTAHACVALHSF